MTDAELRALVTPWGLPVTERMLMDSGESGVVGPATLEALRRFRAIRQEGGQPVCYFDGEYFWAFDERNPPDPPVRGAEAAA